MNINRETENFSYLPDQLLHGYVNEAVDFKCEEIWQDDEKISVSSSETASVRDIPLQSNNVKVKNSSNVHIGDRTYLTIQHNVCSDNEVINQIISEAIGTSKVRTILNVKTTPENLESKNGVAAKGLEFFNEESAKNGIKAITEGGETTNVRNPWLSKYFNPCGHPSAFKLYSIVLVVILLVIGLSLAIWKITGDQHSATTPTSTYPSAVTPSYTTTPIVDTDHNNNSLPEFDYPHPNGWYLVSRRDWNAREPEKTIELLHHPVKNAIIAHTAGGTCYTEPECSDKMRGIQAWAVGDLGFDDVPYNFLVGGDGNAFEGLGWNIKGSHSNKFNSVSIGIAFIGNFVYDRPTPQQLLALKRLLEWGVEIGKLDPDYRLVPHNLTYATLSPGRFIYEQIKTWPHFTEERFYVKT